jgi:hypothetical protein
MPLSAAASCRTPPAAHRRGAPPSLVAAARIAFAAILDSDFVGLDRTGAWQRFFWEKAERLGRRPNCGCSCAVLMRSAFCLMRYRVGIVPATTALRLSRTMAIRRVELADAWAARKLKICLGRAAEMPI